MAYFPDLSPYAYGSTAAAAACQSDLPDLNVGWLEAGQPFPVGEASPDFIAALLRCCTRPVRFYRGRHYCDLCEYDRSAGLDDEDARFVFDLDGRKISGGNGEVRVRAPDGRFYTAPTLISHYVIQHRYLPPTPYVEGIINRARQIHVVCGRDLAAIRAMSVQDRYALCLEFLARYETVESAQLTAVTQTLRNLREAVKPGAWQQWRQGILDADRELIAAKPDLPEHAFGIAFRIMQFFGIARRETYDPRLDFSVEWTVMVIETSIDVGICSEWHSV